MSLPLAPSSSLRFVVAFRRCVERHCAICRSYFVRTIVIVVRSKPKRCRAGRFNRVDHLSLVPALVHPCRLLNMVSRPQALGAARHRPPGCEGEQGTGHLNQRISHLKLPLLIHISAPRFKSGQALEFTFPTPKTLPPYVLAVRGSSRQTDVGVRGSFSWTTSWSTRSAPPPSERFSPTLACRSTCKRTRSSTAGTHHGIEYFYKLLLTMIGQQVPQPSCGSRQSLMIVSCWQGRHVPCTSRQWVLPRRRD